MLRPKKELLGRFTRNKFWSKMAPKMSSPKSHGQPPTLITRTAPLSSSSRMRSHLQSVISRHRDSLARNLSPQILTFNATAPNWSRFSVGQTRRNAPRLSWWPPSSSTARPARPSKSCESAPWPSSTPSTSQSTLTPTPSEGEQHTRSEDHDSGQFDEKHFYTCFCLWGLSPRHV